MFPLREGLPRLLRPEETSLAADAASYALSWRSTSWAPPPESLANLPYWTKGKAKAFWEPKARSLELLLQVLGPPAGRIVFDAGAGTGWLSHRLAERGFRCFATDASDDARIGLGAAVAFDRMGHGFERAIASLARWPIRDGSVDVAVCNASLHYVEDVGTALGEARRTLRPGGRLFVLNSPVHRDDRSARRASEVFQESMRALGAKGVLVDHHRHFVAQELERHLQVHFAEVRRLEPAYGARFRVVRALKGFVLRMELASFPMYEARKT